MLSPYNASDDLLQSELLVDGMFKEDDALDVVRTINFVQGKAETLKDYEDKIENVVIAEPLLGEVGADAKVINKDKEAVAKAITAEAVKEAGFESLEEAVKRELKEETGIDCEPERLVCIHENFFKTGEDVFFHEISCFFTVKPNPELLSIPDGHRTSGGPCGEYLTWVDTTRCEIPVYPEFFKTPGFGTDDEVKHYITRNADMA